MKKFIGIILAIAISFTLIPNVFAYSDVSNREDITILSDLGIIDGFEDDTFRADEALTRAQLVKIICTMLGYSNLANSNTKYSDVTVEHWASGYINQATAMGIISGFEDGAFRPDETVTYEQAIKMIVCTLGYEPAAKALSTNAWYEGYLNIASSIDVLKDVKGSINTPITRGNIAHLVYNSLSIQMMDIKSWSGIGIEYEKSEDTILSKYLEVEKWEGIVTNTPYMSYMAGSDEGEIMLANAVKYNYEGKKTADAFETAKCNKNVEDLIGKKVICYVGEDAYGDWRVFSIAEKDNVNNVIIIKASDINDVQSNYVYYDNGKDRELKIRIADSEPLAVICNYEAVSAFDWASADGYVTFVSNNNDNIYDYIIYYDYDVLGSVVKDIEIYDDTIAFDAEDIEEYDYNDDDVTIIVVKDGTIASIEDIEIDDVITVIGEDNFKIYLVSSKKISGKVTSLNAGEKTVTIDGEEYDYNNVSFTLSDYITAYFNVDNKIIAIDTDDIAVNKYGMIIRAYTSSDDDEYKLEVIGTNGVKGTYIVADKRADSVRTTLSNDLGFTNNGNGKLAYDKITKSIYSLTVRNSDGTVTAIKSAATGDVSKVENKTFDEETMTFGPIDINSSTILFSIEKDSTRTEVKADDVTVGAAVDFFTDDEGEDFVLYPLVPRDEVYSILVGTGITGTISNKNDAVIVETVTTAYIESEDDTGYIITGIQGGKKVEYELFDCARPTEGSVILIGAKENGVITKYTELINKNDIKTDLDNVNGKVREIVGKVDRTKTDGTRLYFDNGDTLLLKSSANYTLVDCTKNSGKITIEKKTKGLSIFGSAEKYNSYVYVRYYDDVQTEVIVYRFNKE